MEVKLDPMRSHDGPVLMTIAEELGESHQEARVQNGLEPLKYLPEAHTHALYRNLRNPSKALDIYKKNGGPPMAL